MGKIGYSLGNLWMNHGKEPQTIFFTFGIEGFEAELTLKKDGKTETFVMDEEYIDNGTLLSELFKYIERRDDYKSEMDIKKTYHSVKDIKKVLKEGDTVFDFALDPKEKYIRNIIRLDMKKKKDRTQKNYNEFNRILKEYIEIYKDAHQMIGIAVRAPEGLTQSRLEDDEDRSEFDGRFHRYQFVAFKFRGYDHVCGTLPYSFLTKVLGLDPEQRWIPDADHTTVLRCLKMLEEQQSL